MRSISISLIPFFKTLAVNPVAVQVPILYSDAWTTPEVSVSILAPFTESTRFGLTMADGTLFEWGEGRGNLNSANVAVLGFPDTLDVAPLTYADYAIVYHQANSGWFLGIGPDSCLVRRFGAVNIMRGVITEPFERRDRLVVGLSLQEYASLCIGDYMSVPLIWSPDLSVYAKANIVLPIQGGVISSPIHVSLQVFEKVRLARFIADHLAVSIIGFGAIATSERYTFTNCDTADIVAQLPSITVELETSKADESVSMSFRPADYLSCEADTSTCRIIAADDDRDLFGINPLMFPEVNLRISKSRVRFCYAV